MDHSAELEERTASLIGPDLARAVVRWVNDDPDIATRAEVVRLVADGDVDGLRSRFGQRLAFGTAGLRGALGAGPNRMNRLVVRQAAAGLMAHLPDGARVVIGHDARHGSETFAADSARVVAAAGGTALVLPAVVPTPLVPFAVRHLGADAGVMVTASHNPPEDNGYKVYLSDGAQIVPPVDSAIAVAILEASQRPVELSAADDERIVHVGAEVATAYLDLVERSRFLPGGAGVETVYTAMHGVGRDLLVAAFARCGFPAPHQVSEQCEPDPDFPTVSFPNPEEPGALDRAIALARQVSPTLVIAHDPDADRLGVAIPHGNDWRALTGNEVGALLADHILRHTDGDDRLVATTIVSSRLLARMAEAAGTRFAETLTGFKWIVRPAIDDPTLRLVFGYEEALGYAVSPEVRDKDGITAAVVFVELAGALAAAGLTVADRLDQIAVEHGLHVTETWSVRFDGDAAAAATMAALMATMRERPPTELAGRPVTRVFDYGEGTTLPPSDAVLVELGSEARILVRPSGTEPKAKIYLEVMVPTTEATVAADRTAAHQTVAALRDAMAIHLGVTND